MEAKKRRGVNIIPHDIVEEILVKVPVKSLVRFKAVSKEWRGTIESKWFVDKHTRLGGGQARIVKVVSRFGRKISKSLSLENLLLMPPIGGIVHTSLYRRIRHLRLPPRYHKISEPCDGLFCIYTKLREFTLVNPATTSRRILPDPDPDRKFTLAQDDWDTVRSTLGIGRENVASPRYKLVCLFVDQKEEVNKSIRCTVLALDSNTWRYVDPPNSRVYYKQPIIHLDGVLYCFGFDMMEKRIDYINYNLKLLAFDLRTETFQSFSVTPDVGSRYLPDLSLCALNHRLCIYRNYTNANRTELFFKIWSLDITKGSWEIMYSIEFSCLPPELNNQRIIPVAAINNYLILSDLFRTVWVHYGSKTHIFRCINSRSNNASAYFMSFFDTLVSVNQ